MTPAPSLDDRELALIDAYWRAANYLSVGQIYLLDNPLLREPLRAEHVEAAAARALGDHAGAELPLRPHEPRDPRPRPRRDLRHRARPRRAGTRREHVPRGHLQRGLPRHRPRRGRPAAAVPSVLVPRRHPEPRRARDAGFDPRRRRARLRAGARLRRRASTTRTCSSAASSATARPRRARSPRAGTRTSSSTRRPTARCCRSCTSTATRSPTRRCSRASRTTSSQRSWRATATSRCSSRATTRRRCTSAMAATLDRALDRHRRDPAGGARRRAGAPALADDRPAHAEGLDRPEGGRRPARRGLVPLAPGPALRGPRDGPEHLAALEAWMRSYRPEELFDERRRARRRARRARARRATGAWAPTRTPTAACCCATCACPTSATTRSTCRRPATTHGRGDARARRLPARRDAHGRRAAQLPRLRARRDRVEPPRRRVRGDRPPVDGRDAADRRPPRARRPRDGGAERAPVPGLARGLPAHRPPRPLQLLRGVHPHRRLDVQPAREVAEGHATASRGGGRSPR